MTPVLLEALRQPRSAASLSTAALTLLVAQARTTNLLAALGLRLEAAGVLEDLAPEARRHFRSAVLAQEKQQRDLAYELSHLARVFNALGEPLVLLKGAAYIAAGLDCSRGRLISDIDLLVTEASIDRAERSLQSAGWEGVKQDTYDDRYYRRWMHEIPPLVHRSRGSVLDVHHTILPPTAGPRLPAERLFEELQPIVPGVQGLGAEDMVLHSAAHLFYESEFPHALRDLWDQRCLLLQFSEQIPDFWDRLAARAGIMDLETPLWLSLRYVDMHFAISPPPEVLARLRPKAAALRSVWWDFLFRRIFRPDHPSTRLRFHATAEQLLFVRGHALRMPPWLLLPHLARKGLRRLGPATEGA
ncbi:nucleotidyltransferase family protein [Pseudohaliea sp.]|uniref:nucleotidyltransferase domain-containing protein n=1 Tax=Pseudohaliea sp. TaxID=2740289 RepID=UPI0032EE483B